MKTEVCATPSAAAVRAASLIASELRRATGDRGCATLALSGGTTPIAMLHELAAAKLAWPQIHVFQVDERIVAMDDERRNMQAIIATLAALPIPAENLHAMPVDRGTPEVGAAQYFDDLCAVAGVPPCLDLVHLGLGGDGHTASLFPGDPAAASDHDVAVSGRYQGLRRMTLTLAMLNRARKRIWLITGSGKREILRRFLDADPELIASHVRRDESLVVLDREAAGETA